MASSRLRRVAVLVLEGAKPLDVGIPAQVFTTRASMSYFSNRVIDTLELLASF